MSWLFILAKVRRSRRCSNGIDEISYSSVYTDTKETNGFTLLV